MKAIRRPVLVLHDDRLLREQLRGATRQRYELHFVEGWDALLDAVRGSPASTLVVVDPYWGVPGRREVAAELEHLMRTLPSTTVIAAMEAGRSSFDQVRWMGEVGVAQVICLEEEASALALERRLRSAWGRPLKVLLERTLPPNTSGAARSILQAASSVVAQGGQSTDLARSLHVTTRTLLRWCRRAGLPPPRRLLSWMRVLLAAELLDDPGRTVLDVALSCGYTSDASLRHAIQGRLGLAPRELRSRGAFEVAGRGFLKALMEARVITTRYRQPRARLEPDRRRAS